MAKLRIISFAFVLAMLFAMLPIQTSAASYNDFLEFEDVKDPLPKTNYLYGGGLNSDSCLKLWKSNSQKLEHVKTASGGGYLRMSNISLPYVGFDFRPSSTVGAGIYKMTAYFRTAYEGELTELRFVIYDTNHETNTSGVYTAYVYPTSDEWLKVEFYIEFEGDFIGFKTAGGPRAEMIQAYCVDNISMEKVDKIPEGYVRPASFGTPITKEQAVESNNGSMPSYPDWDPEFESQYDVKGIIINQDTDFCATLINTGVTPTKANLESYARGFAGSHVTDYFINVFSQQAIYPSKVASNYVDRYRTTELAGQAVNFKNESYVKGAFSMFDLYGLDYIDIWCKTFKEVGINPWISFRMNDAHNRYTAPKITFMTSDFYIDNPEMIRVKHGSTTNTYYDNTLDFTYDKVREYMLDVINESLSRYDCHGIELDFQREIWLWHTGGEYNGLDLMSDFMRKLDGIIKTYEEKYGHDIKVAARVASDIQTNYDFGLDVITWAAEGLIDMVIPTGRFETTDFDVPVKSWVAVMHPHGVEVAPGVEHQINTGANSVIGTHGLDTLAGLAASWYSQGADKFYIYNHYLTLSSMMKEEYHKSSPDIKTIGGGTMGYWNMITTVGSYDKLMNCDRKLIMTYNDIAAKWKGVDYKLPFRIAIGETGMLRMPVGDIPEGAKVTLKLGVNDAAISYPPTVHINSKLVKSTHTEHHSEGYTTSKVLCYEVPAEALDDMFIVVEITPEKYFAIDYVEVYIEPVR